MKEEKNFKKIDFDKEKLEGSEKVYHKVEL